MIIFLNIVGSFVKVSKKNTIKEVSYANFKMTYKKSRTPPPRGEGE